jgi:hypothetical protein
VVHNNSSREQATGEGDIAMPITPRGKASSQWLRSTLAPADFWGAARHLWHERVSRVYSYTGTSSEGCKLLTQTSGKKLPTNRNFQIKK